MVIIQFSEFDTVVQLILYLFLFSLISAIKSVCFFRSHPDDPVMSLLLDIQYCEKVLGIRASCLKPFSQCVIK